MTWSHCRERPIQPTQDPPSGSHLAINHYLDPADDPAAHRLARELENRFIRGLGSGWFRTRERIASLFDGLELVEPGLGRAGRLVALRSRAAPAIAGGAADAGCARPRTERQEPLNNVSASSFFCAFAPK
ncbi:SAM-dependent methyltransferase [Nocardia abscessus]|uniref:SAM-dependent methyltransferase n=1 Tax=Nocardia abscessus TaxID=120957 RepID=UPI0024590C59|nr:SAM-dependent methyltransferase [Nocardia abscessus]